MPNHVTLSELNVIAEELGKKAQFITYTTTVGFFKKSKKEGNEIWSSLPNLDRIAAFYTLVDENGDKTDDFPARIKYIHYVDWVAHQFKLNRKINKIMKQAIKLDEEDEAYVILKYI